MREVLKADTGTIDRSALKECGGRELRLLLEAGLRWLDQHVALVNSLNVYPVPDGDTGTNMLLTMQAAMREMEKCDSDESASAVAHAVAHGALMGARGNSGVILSQILRGFARGLDAKKSFTAVDFAFAAQEASATAYKGVIKPVEGTILTVAREAASAASLAADDDVDLYTQLERTLEAAQAAVELTPDLLPVLKEAGVVDAGGKGLTFILEGALRFLRGEDVGSEASGGSESKPAAPHPAMHFYSSLSQGMGSKGELSYGYDVQFILKGDDLNVDEIRSKVNAMGESTLVVGDSRVIKVHVHVQNPGEPLSYGVALGSLSDVVVENLDEQHREFSKGQLSLTTAVEKRTDTATVAVVSGPGMVRIFESLGVSAIVPGGQTMNPSTEEMLSAVEALNAHSVILLPNNANVVLAAKQAQELAKKEVYVVPTESLPQGIGAMLAFNLLSGAGDNAKAMEEAIKDIHTIEITRAVRSTSFNGLPVQEGEHISLLDDDLVACNSDVASVLLRATESLDMDDYEILTMYYGEGVGEEEVASLVEVIEEKFPSLEIEVKDGGQPYYEYIISIE